MPSFYDNTYFFLYDTGTSTSERWVNISVPSVAQVQQEYEEYQRECERQDQIFELQMQMHEQQIEEERQLLKDKERYPLFFWRETCVKSTLKDGIV